MLFLFWHEAVERWWGSLSPFHLTSVDTQQLLGSQWANWQSPLETPSLGLHVGARVTASLSYFPAQPCVWFCFVLGFFALFCFSLLCFSLLCGAGCCGIGSGKGCPGAAPVSASLPRAAQEHQLSRAPQRALSVSWQTWLCYLLMSQHPHAKSN